MAQAKTKAIVPAKQKVSTAIANPAEMEDWEKEIYQKAKDAKAAETLGLPRISHRGGVLKLNDKKIDGNKLQHAVIAYGLSKAYYEGEYDSNVAQTPVCYAFAPAVAGAESEMKPHAAAPKKQHDQCSGCPHNEFGTAKKGNGKACKDERRVLVMVGVSDPESIQAAEVAQYNVPPASLKNWGRHLSACEEVTPFGVLGCLSEMSTEPSDTGGYKLIFKPTDRLERDQVRALQMKAKTVEAELSKPYPAIAQDEAPKAKRSKASNKKLD